MYNCSQQEKISVLSSTSGSNTGFVFGGSENGRVFIWNVHSGQLIKMFDAHLNGVAAICCVSEGSECFLITGGKDTVIHVWNLATLLDVKTLTNRKMDPMFTFSSHSLAITSLHCTRGSQPKLISTSMDRTCKVWDLFSGSELCSVVVPCSILSASMDPSEHFLYMGGSNGRVYQVNIYPFVPQFVDDIVGYSSTGNNNGQSEEAEFSVGHNIAFVSESSGMIGGARNLTVEHVSSLNSNENKYNRNYCCVYGGHTNSVTDISLSADGTKMVTSSKDGKCLVWDTESKQILFAFKKHASASDFSVVSATIVTLSLAQFQTFHHEENVIRSVKGDQKKKSEALYRRLKPLKQMIGNQTLETQDPEDANEDGCSVIQLNILDDNWKMLTDHAEFDADRNIPSAFLDVLANPLDSVDLGFRDIATSSLFGITTNVSDRFHSAVVERHLAEQTSNGQQAPKKRKVDAPSENEKQLREEVLALHEQLEQLKKQRTAQQQTNKELLALITQTLQINAANRDESDEEDEDSEDDVSDDESEPDTKPIPKSTKSAPQNKQAPSNKKQQAKKNSRYF